MPRPLAYKLDLGFGHALPLAALSKAPRKHFDLCDHTGASVPVLGKEENGLLAHSILVTLATDVLAQQLNDGSISDDEFDELTNELDELAGGSSDAGEQRWRSLQKAATSGDDIRHRLLCNSDFARLAELLSVNYILFALLPDRPRDVRSILKFSFAVPFAPISRRLEPLWTDTRAFKIELSDADWCESFHLELALPEELRAKTAVLYDTNTATRKGKPQSVGHEEKNVDRVSLYASREDLRQHSIGAYIELAPEKRGAIAQSFALGLIATTALAFGYFSSECMWDKNSVVAVLIASAALFSGATVVRAKHPLVPRFFRAQTWCATATSIAAVIAALNVAFGWPPSHHDCLWGGALIVSGIALLRQTLSFCRAPGYS